MARTINEQEYIQKRNEILAAARRLVFVIGYERMAIQDILAELKISSGAFYHYFESKPRLLEGLVEWMQRDAEQPLLAVVKDPQMSAPHKLQSFFYGIDQMRMANHSVVTQMLRVWYTDQNAIIRQKVAAATIERRAPLLIEIIQQGIREGAFNTRYPGQAGEILLVLWQGMGDAHARQLLSLRPGDDPENVVEQIVQTQAAYLDAIERALGAAAAFLTRMKAETVREWIERLAPAEPTIV